MEKLGRTQIKRSRPLSGLSILKGVWQFITLKYQSQRKRNTITVKGKNVTNPENIANGFNNSFTNIGPNLSKTIPKSKNEIKIFLNNS